MKHCAKKLLGLVFALALCLAVGGNALADGPEAADVWMLSDAWMLADEPNVTTAPDTTTVGDLANDGYTVTIPTTVTVDSGTDTSELKITAEMKQWRTLEIDIASNNSWKLAYDGAAGTNAPQVDYTLKNTVGGGHTSQGMIWTYDATNHKIAYTTTRLTAVDKAEIPLSVNVTDPSQATMSGTYSDTLAFDFKITKQSVTYTINVYHQEMALTNNHFNRADNAPKYQALKMVDKVGTDGAPIGDAKPDEVYTLEYGFANGAPVGSPPETWTRPRTGHSVPEDEDTRCWEDLTYGLNLQQNYNEDNKDIVVNLNLVRKWCWLDVNGITNKDENGVPADGNQGGKIASFVNIKVSDGKSWSVWYWYTTGDDYWGTFPYGTEFQLGLHRVKDGYAYDTDDAGNVAIYANNKLEYKTNPPISENGTTYRVYQGKLEGKPVDETLHPTSGGGNVHDGAGGKALPRYCYNVCFVDGITYYANGGTGGREDTNIYHGPHTTFQYTAGMTLADPLSDELTGCKFTAPAGKEFAGWSTTKDYIAGQTKLYAPGTPESKVEWPTPKPSTSHNDTLPNKDGQTVCRTLYAQWGYNITVQFEDEKGYSTNDGSGPVATRGGTMDDKYSFTLEKQVVADGADWTLDLTNSVVQEKITAATNAAKAAAGDTRTEVDNNFVWKIGNGFENKISAADLKKGKRTLMIQRRRYLLSVISVDVETTTVKTIATNANEEAYGTFDVTINDGQTDLGVKGKSHCQVGLNYGAKYTVNEMKGIGSYSPMNAVILKSLRPNDKLEGSWFTDGTVDSTDVYTNWMTGKESSIHYYKTGEDDPKDGYVGDPVRVAFNDSIGSSDTPVAGPTLAPGLSGPTVGDADADGDDTAGDTGEDITQPPAGTGLTLRYHANFVADDAVEEAVKTVACAPGADVVLKTCMFKRAGYTFTGWNTEKDGMGRAYKANGVPVTDWSDGDTVDLYAQWEKTVPLKPVVSGFDEDTGLFDPFAPPEELDPGFGIDSDADPADEEGPADDADAVDDAQAVADEEAAAAPPEELDFDFGIDPDAAVGGPAPLVRW